MAEAISDAHVAAVLRVFVRGCGPVVQRLRERGDPVDDETDVDGGLLGKVRDQLTQAAFPGSDAWARMNADERSDWWVGRVGRLTALVASFAGLAGAIGDRLPLKDALGSAGQGLLLCAIASERGVDDVGTKVRLLGSVLFDRDIDPVVAAGGGDGEIDEEPAGRSAVRAVAEEPPEGKRFGAKAAATVLWRQGEMLTAVRDELESRPKGHGYHRALGKVPLVGMAGSYLGERAALKRCAKAATKWIASVNG